jgi:hypothetical protein
LSPYRKFIAIDLRRLLRKPLFEKRGFSKKGEGGIFALNQLH